MEPERNYLMVGIIVIALTLGALGFVVWLAGLNKSSDTVQYQIFFAESVNGLAVDSPVKFRGVDVGKVTKIEIPKDMPSRVRVVADLKDGTPIMTSTVAVLQMQGITGTSYIELRAAKAGDPPLAQPIIDGMMTIPAAPSDFQKIVQTVPQMLQKISDLADNLQNFVSPENSTRFANIMTNMEKFSTDVGGDNGSGQSLIQNLAQTAKDIGAAAKSLNEIAVGSRADTKAILKNTAQTMEKIGALAENTQQLSKQGYSDLSALLIEMKKTARDVQSLSRELKENPSQIIIPTQPGGVKVK